jgi:peptide chain release factor subunit 1
MDWYLTLDRLYDDGKDKQFTLSFAPFKPIRQSLFLCDKKFHAEALHQLLV